MTSWGILALVCGSVLVATWLGYPAVILGLGRWRARRSEPNRSASPTPVISVILATREAPDIVRRRVQDLARTAYPLELMELIVAIDGGTGGYGLEGVAPRVRELRVVSAPEPGGKAAALNAGVEVAQGEILIFADAHQTFEPEAIPRLVAALDSPDFGAVSGSLLLPATGKEAALLTAYRSLERGLRAAEASVHSTIGVSGSIYAIRRALWEPLPSGLLLDDLYVPMRLVLAGHRAGFAADAQARDARAPLLVDEYRRKVRTLTGNFQLCVWLPAVLNPLKNPVWIMFVFHKLFRLVTPYALLGLGIGGLGLVLTAWPDAALPLLGGAVLATLWVSFATRGTGRLLRDSLLWAVTMQGAVVAASLNGLRGRWDVWHR